VTIVGLGLMGGSLALALKERNVCRNVVGLVRRTEAVHEAVQAGAVDEATTDPVTALSEADIVVYSTPIRVIIRQLTEYAPFYKAGAIITDMGSTKREIVQAMAALPEHVYPVGSHPMCGKELTGLSAAEASLYEGAPWILSPLDRTALKLVQELAEAIGAKPQVISAARHDKLVAAISHLPYALSVALVLSAQQVAAEDPVLWEVAASGFRDTSRVAGSDVTMMLDILLTNREAVGHMLRLAHSQLDSLTKAIDTGDEASLRQLLERAAQQRRSLYR
jgi:prephenate dehydrogenase